MPNVFNQLLGAMSGGFTGYAQEQDKKEALTRQAQADARNAQNDAYLNEDRASQRALRDAQAGTATQRAAQDAYLRTPEFQSLYVAARGGDETALAKVASAVAGHPDASTFMTPLTREPKEFAPLATPSGYVNRDGTPLMGKDGKPLMPMATVPKAPQFTPVTIGGDDGGPSVVKPFNTRTGETGPTLGNAKPPVTRIESATNTAATARLHAAVSEMNNAHAGMDEYEAKLVNGTANINGLQQFAGRVASAFTHDDPVSMAAQSTALAALNTQNPELARYIRRGLSFAEGESMISQRPSDFRTKMSAFLSQAATGASPDMIKDIQSRRNSILVPLNNTVQPTQPSSPSHDPGGNVDLGAPGVARLSPQQLWDAAVRKHGQAKVLAEYGPRP